MSSSWQRVRLRRLARQMIYLEHAAHLAAEQGQADYVLLLEQRREEIALRRSILLNGSEDVRRVNRWRR